MATDTGTEILAALNDRAEIRLVNTDEEYRFYEPFCGTYCNTMHAAAPPLYVGPTSSQATPSSAAPPPLSSIAPRHPTPSFSSHGVDKEQQAKEVEEPEMNRYVTKQEVVKAVEELEMKV
ncbi:hypothetical protein OSTOST_24665, partial [Ostertagia ostertagi]